MKNLEKSLPKLSRLLTLLAMLFIIVRGAFFITNIPDTPFHMQRLQFIADNLSLGGSWRIYTTALCGYGYASPLFYGDVLIYPFALLRYLGADLLFCFQTMCAAYLVALFFVARHVFRQILPRDAADVATMVYVVMPPILRHTVEWSHGMLLALIFMPIALLGLYRILCQGAGVGSPRGWLPLALGVAGLLLSHILSSVMLAAMLLALVAMHLKEIKRAQVMSIVLAALVCLALTAWFLVPMLEQMTSDKFFVTSADIPLGKWQMSSTCVPLLGWLFPPKALRALGFEVDYYDSMGMLACIVTLIIIARYQRRELLANRFMFSLSLITLFCVWEQSSFFPHDLCQPVHGVFQYAHRVALVALLCTALLVGWFYERTRRRLLVVPILLIICCFFATYSLYEVVRVVSGNDVIEVEKDTDSCCLGAAEYMPARAYIHGQSDEDNRLWQRAIIERGERVVVCSAACDSVTASCKREGYKTIVDYAHGSGKLSLELPLVMYKGYRAVDVASGDELPVAESEHGLLLVQTTKGSGQIEVYYAGTFLQSATAILSLLSLIVLLIYLFFLRRSSDISSAFSSLPHCEEQRHQ